MNPSLRNFRFVNLTLTVMICLFSFSSLAQHPLRLAIAGLSHGHVDWAFNRPDRTDIELVGIYEADPELVERYATRYKLDRSLFFDKLERMLDQAKPQAVSAFGAISEHITVVRAAAPRKIHVMVEKPLAFTLADANEIQQLAKQHNIHVLTNFETSWYASNQHVKQLAAAGDLGQIRKVMVNDGHEGPKEIGVSKEFLQILTDPKKNGAGALIDFGCYGANLMTWLMNGDKPLSVTAVVHQNKPEVYTKVDDEASIILQYDNAQCIIQGSWNWPFSRKDMEVYGDKGYAIAVDATSIRQRFRDKGDEVRMKLDARPAPFNDPFALLAAVVNKKLSPSAYDLYDLPINVTAVEILDAAIQSAISQKTVFLEK